MDITKSIGKAIAYYREQKEWSTVQLASFAELSQGSISMYENGKRNPSEEALERIASALGITLKTLLERAESFEQKEPTAKEASSQHASSKDNDYERMRRLDRIYSYNDYVFQLNNDVVIGVNARVHDLMEGVDYSRRAVFSRTPYSRRDTTTLIAHLVEKTFKDFLDDHKEEISLRLDDELQRLNMDAYHLIEELRNNNKN